MKKTQKILLIVILITIIMFSNSYAIATSKKISTIKLSTSNTNQTEFKVRFSGNPKVSNESKVDAAITNDLCAIINATGLTMDENTETVTYIIQNTSKDLSAELSIETTNSNKEYFLIESKIEKTTLTKGEATKIIIKIQLIKEPVGKSEKSTIGIQLRATPIQPTEDGNSNTGTNTSTSPSDSTIPNTTTQTSPNTKLPNSQKNTKKYYNYYEKDETPKTGNFKIINIFGR